MKEKFKRIPGQKSDISQIKTNPNPTKTGGILVKTIEDCNKSQREEADFSAYQDLDGSKENA